MAVRRARQTTARKTNGSGQLKPLALRFTEPELQARARRMLMRVGTRDIALASIVEAKRNRLVIDKFDQVSSGRGLFGVISRMRWLMFGR